MAKTQTVLAVLLCVASLFLVDTCRAKTYNEHEVSRLTSEVSHLRLDIAYRKIRADSLEEVIFQKNIQLAQIKSRADGTQRRYDSLVAALPPVAPQECAAYVVALSACDIALAGKDSVIQHQDSIITDLNSRAEILDTAVVVSDSALDKADSAVHIARPRRVSPLLVGASVILGFLLGKL